MVFDELEDYDEAIQLFEKSLEISTLQKDTAQIAQSYQNIAISYQNKKDLVYADKDMVATVLRNLIFNAVKFSPKGSLIMIKAFSTDSYVQIDVIDNGVGIPAGMIEKLFRIDNDVTTHGTEGETGSGLGLVLCHEFVEKNAGKIWVESTPGKGSIFSFTLPLSK